MEHLWTPWRYPYISRADKGSGKPGVPEALGSWPGNFNCVFCNVIAAVDYNIAAGMPAEQAEEAAGILLRGSETFLILNAFPYNNGHLMVVPYCHESSLAALPWSAAEELLELTRRAERAIRDAYHPDGINMGLNLGEAAGAGVAQHLHLHAVPRWSGDTNFITVVAETRILPEMLADTWQRLRAILATSPGTK